MAAVRRASFAELDARTLHDLLRLRAEVFVVEQQCAYLDLDGLDADPATVHWWAAGDDGAVLSCLRVVPDGAGVRIGRVATAPHARGRGLAASLLRDAVASVGDVPVVLHAQSHLAGWYGSLGFVADGDEYVEDGIPHVPMRLAR